jgi:hypothetical protein
MSRRIESTLGRRDVLKGLLWGTAGAAAVTVGGSTAAVAADKKSSLTLEVACLAHSFYLIPRAYSGTTPPVAVTEGGPAPDVRGSTFVVEGVIYPAGTLPAGGFDPTKRAGIGTWICRGWILGPPSRPEPMVITTQEYVLGALGKDMPSIDQIVSDGMESAGTVVRAVVGGTGRYRGARGQVVQSGIGTNTTSDPLVGAGPNFRFEFDLI